MEKKIFQPANSREHNSDWWPLYSTKMVENTGEKIEFDRKGGRVRVSLRAPEGRWSDWIEGSQKADYRSAETIGRSLILRLRQGLPAEEAECSTPRRSAVMAEVRSEQEKNRNLWPYESVVAVINGERVVFEIFWDAKTGLVSIKREGGIMESAGKTTGHADRVWGVSLDTIRKLYGNNVEFKI